MKRQKMKAYGRNNRALVKQVAVVLAIVVGISSALCLHDKQQRILLTYADLVNAPLDVPLPNIKPPITKESYDLPLMRGIQFDTNNTQSVTFYFDSQDKKHLSRNDIDRMIKYFLGFLTIPQDQIWVNLSPYEPGRIVAPALGQLDAGKDLLLQDYVLKQITAALTDPKTPYGKIFWQQVHQAAQKIAKTTNVPIKTFYKVWIIPEVAEVYEYTSATSGNKKTKKQKNKKTTGQLANRITGQPMKTTTFIKNARLKVMLESDYLAYQKTHDVIHNTGDQPSLSELRRAGGRRADGLTKQINKQAEAIFRQQLLPIIERQVNHSAAFAPLRQIFYCLVLADYFKAAVQNDPYYAAYINAEKTQVLAMPQAQQKQQTIYASYARNFHHASTSVMAERISSDKNTLVRQRYISGGFASGPYKQNQVPTDTLPAQQVTGVVANIAREPGPLLPASPVKVEKISEISEEIIEKMIFKEQLLAGNTQNMQENDELITGISTCVGMIVFDAQAKAQWAGHFFTTSFNEKDVEPALNVLQDGGFLIVFGGDDPNQEIGMYDFTQEYIEKLFAYLKGHGISQEKQNLVHIPLQNQAQKMWIIKLKEDNAIYVKHLKQKHRLTTNGSACCQKIIPLSSRQKKEQTPLSPPQTWEQYDALSETQKQLLRKAFSEKLDKSYALQNDRLIGELIAAAEEIRRTFPKQRIVGLGRTPLWFIETAQLIEEHPGTKADPSRFDSVAFSGKWFELDHSIPMREPFQWLERLEDKPSEQAVQAYRQYLKEKGMDPRSICSRKEKTVLVEYIVTGSGLRSFLQILIDWAKEQQLLSELYNHLDLVLLYDANTLNINRFHWQGLKAEYLHISKDLITDKLNNPDLYHDSLGVKYPHQQWQTDRSQQLSAGQYSQLVRFRVMDYLAQKGWVNNWSKKATANEQMASSAFISYFTDAELFAQAERNMIENGVGYDGLKRPYQELFDVICWQLTPHKGKNLAMHMIATIRDGQQAQGFSKTKGEQNVAVLEQLLGAVFSWFKLDKRLGKRDAHRFFPAQVFGRINYLLGSGYFDDRTLFIHETKNLFASPSPAQFFYCYEILAYALQGQSIRQERQKRLWPVIELVMHEVLETMIIKQELLQKETVIADIFQQLEHKYGIDISSGYKRKFYNAAPDKKAHYLARAIQAMLLKDITYHITDTGELVSDAAAVVREILDGFDIAEFLYEQKLLKREEVFFSHEIMEFARRLAKYIQITIDPHIRVISNDYNKCVIGKGAIKLIVIEDQELNGSWKISINRCLSPESKQAFHWALSGVQGKLPQVLVKFILGEKILKRKPLLQYQTGEAYVIETKNKTAMTEHFISEMFAAQNSWAPLGIVRQICALENKQTIALQEEKEIVIDQEQKQRHWTYDYLEAAFNVFLAKTKNVAISFSEIIAVLQAGDYVIKAPRPLAKVLAASVFTIQEQIGFMSRFLIEHSVDVPNELKTRIANHFMDILDEAGNVAFYDPKEEIGLCEQVIEALLIIGAKRALKKAKNLMVIGLAARDDQFYRNITIQALQLVKAVLSQETPRYFQAMTILDIRLDFFAFVARGTEDRETIGYFDMYYIIAEIRKSLLKIPADQMRIKIEAYLAAIQQQETNHSNDKSQSLNPPGGDDLQGYIKKAVTTQQELTLVMKMEQMSLKEKELKSVRPRAYQVWKMIKKVAGSKQYMRQLQGGEHSVFKNEPAARQYIKEILEQARKKIRARKNKITFCPAQIEKKDPYDKRTWGYILGSSSRLAWDILLLFAPRNGVWDENKKMKALEYAVHEGIEPGIIKLVIEAIKNNDKQKQKVLQQIYEKAHPLYQRKYKDALAAYKSWLSVAQQRTLSKEERDKQRYCLEQAAHQLTRSVCVHLFPDLYHQEGERIVSELKKDFQQFIDPGGINLSLGKNNKHLYRNPLLTTFPSKKHASKAATLLPCQGMSYTITSIQQQDIRQLIVGANDSPLQAPVE